MDPDVEKALRNILVILTARGFVPSKLPGFVAMVDDLDLTGDPWDIVEAIDAAQIAAQDPLP